MCIRKVTYLQVNGTKSTMRLEHGEPSTLALCRWVSKGTHLSGSGIRKKELLREENIPKLAELFNSNNKKLLTNLGI